MLLRQLRQISGLASPLQSPSEYFVRAFAIRKIVEPIVNFCIGGEGGEDLFEVCIVGTVACVVTLA